MVYGGYIVMDSSWRSEGCGTVLGYTYYWDPLGDSIGDTVPGR
jgi:hypothetical protein